MPLFDRGSSKVMIVKCKHREVHSRVINMIKMDYQLDGREHTEYKNLISVYVYTNIH